MALAKPAVIGPWDADGCRTPGDSTSRDPRLAEVGVGSRPEVPTILSKPSALESSMDWTAVLAFATVFLGVAAFWQGSVGRQAIQESRRTAIRAGAPALALAIRSSDWASGNMTLEVANEGSPALQVVLDVFGATRRNVLDVNTRHSRLASPVLVGEPKWFDVQFGTGGVTLARDTEGGGPWRFSHDWIWFLLTYLSPTGASVLAAWEWSTSFNTDTDPYPPLGLRRFLIKTPDRTPFVPLDPGEISTRDLLRWLDLKEPANPPT